MTERQKGLEVFQWTEQGYSPLVFSHDWQVALLNWEPVFDIGNLGEIERHNLTDEVFVLLKGNAVLITIGQEGLLISEMVPGVVYNVTMGAWHNLISTRNATWVIVEDRGTHLTDTEIRQLTVEEKSAILRDIPKWVLPPH